MGGMSLPRVGAEALVVATPGGGFWALKARGGASVGGPALGLGGGMGLKVGTVGGGGVLHPPPALTFTMSGPWLASLILG